MKAGKESYKVVSAFDQFEYRDEAPLFRRPADNFEMCVFGLNLVKRDMERLQQTYYRGLQEALETALALYPFPTDVPDPRRVPVLHRAEHGIYCRP
jgi:hypothetical protein